MLQKTGKRDLRDPNAWRPIALLNCLGKGLERALAKRIANIDTGSEPLFPSGYAINDTGVSRKDKFLAAGIDRSAQSMCAIEWLPLLFRMRRLLLTNSSA